MERADNSPKWIVRRAAKAALASALCMAGARWVVRAAGRREAGGARVLILSYHLPVPDCARSARQALPSLLVSAATLARQLEQLGREREIVSLDDACRILSEPRRGGSRSLDVAAVTFDDAYAGVHEVALPVLARLRVPAVVYVPTGYVGTGRRLLHDRLYGALVELRARRLPYSGCGLPAREARTLARCAGEGPGSTLDLLIAQVPHPELAAVADALEARLGTSEQDLPDETRLLSWDALRGLKAGGVEPGGHTVNHVALANVSLAHARAEIQGCRDQIAAGLGAPPRHFAYPNGCYTPRVKGAVQAAGFVSAVTIEDRENRRGGDLFSLKRKTLWENSTLGALRYSEALAACNLDGVFGMLGWQRTQRGDRPDLLDDEDAWERQVAG